MGTTAQFLRRAILIMIHGPPHLYVTCAQVVAKQCVNFVTPALNNANTFPSLQNQNGLPRTTDTVVCAGETSDLLLQ